MGPSVRVHCAKTNRTENAAENRRAALLCITGATDASLTTSPNLRGNAVMADGRGLPGGLPMATLTRLQLAIFNVFACLCLVYSCATGAGWELTHAAVMTALEARAWRPK